MLIRLSGNEPIYRQIYGAIRSSILSGQMRSGAPLPSTRELAKQLGVSRTVVLLAYDQLLAEGYIRGVRGSGTVVCEGILVPYSEKDADSKAERPVVPKVSEFADRVLAESAFLPKGPLRLTEAIRYDFHYGNRHTIDFPHRAWQRLASRYMAHGLASGSSPAGYMPLREAVAAYLQNTHAVRCTPEQIVIVSGSQQGLDLLARLFLNAGDSVVIEEPHYHGARQVFAAAGARLIPCGVDEDGLCVDELPRGGASARLVYVTPSHQFPTGVVLPLPRRLALIAWAREHNAFIIEDDYDGELRYDCRPIEAVQALDREGRVIYLGTFSKALSAELRLGYVVVPHSLLHLVLPTKWMSDLFEPTVTQAVVADMLREGHYERHLRRLREVNAARRRALLDAVKEHFGDRATVSGVKAGLHAMVWLPTVPVKELPLLVARAKRLGVAVYPATSYYLREPTRSAVLIGYSSYSVAEIKDGIKLFAQAVRSSWWTARSYVRRAAS